MQPTEANQLAGGSRPQQRNKTPVGANRDRFRACHKCNSTSGCERQNSIESTPIMKANAIAFISTSPTSAATPRCTTPPTHQATAMISRGTATKSNMHTTRVFVNVIKPDCDLAVRHRCLRGCNCRSRRPEAAAPHIAQAPPAKPRVNCRTSQRRLTEDPPPPPPTPTYGRSR